MTDQPRSPHAQHDDTLIAAYAADDLAGVELERARALTSACMACAALEADLRALVSATRRGDLPVPARPREFRLSAADAARLRPSGWRRFVAAFATPKMAFTQPLAAGLTTLGVAGLLLASLPAISFSGSGGAAPAAAPSDLTQIEAESEGRYLTSEPVPMSSAAGGAPAASAAASGSAAPASAAPSASAVTGAEPAEGQQPGMDSSAAPGASAAAAPSVDQQIRSVEDDDLGTAEGRSSGVGDLAAPRETPSILMILAGSLLIAGLGLYALRWFGRHLA